VRDQRRHPSLPLVTTESPSPQTNLRLAAGNAASGQTSSVGFARPVARRGRILKERAGGAWFAATRGFAFSSLCAAAAMLAAFCAPFCATASAQTPNVQFMGASAPLFTAGLSSPMFTAVDANGNVYISDTGNARVLKETLQANGSYVQSYVANNSFLIAPAGIAVDGSGNVYIADEGYAEWVIKMEPQTDGSYLEYTVKTSTPLSSPTNVAVDASGNVYIADTGNIRVLKETPNGNGTYKESTVANQTSIDVLYAPVGLALDSSGDVYIGDQSYNAIYEMELQSNGSYLYSGAITGDGLSYPFGIALSPDGTRLFVANSGGNDVLEISGGTAPVVTNLHTPTGVAMDAYGNLYIADLGNNRIVKQSPQGWNFGPAAVGSAASSTASFLFYFDNSGKISDNLWGGGLLGGDSMVVDAGTGSCTINGASYTYKAGDLCTVDVDFRPLFPGLQSGAVSLNSTANQATIAEGFASGTGLGPELAMLPGAATPDVTGGLSNPQGVAVDLLGDIYIADTTLSSVAMVGPGASSVSSGTSIGSGFTNARAVAVDGMGNVYVGNGSSLVMEAINADHSYTQIEISTSGLGLATGIAVDGEGNIYISDYTNSQVLKETPYAGMLGDYIQSVVVAYPGVFKPMGLAVDGNGNLYIADYGNERVVKETPIGSGYSQTIPVSFGGSSGVLLNGIVVDSNGVIYVVDSAHSQVLEEMPSGNSYTQSTVAFGSLLDSPEGLARDEYGNLYVADAGHSRIVKYEVSGEPALTFASTPEYATSADSPQTVTVENIGTAPLSFSGITWNSNFPEGSSSTDCSTSEPVLAGANCTLTIDFTPGVAFTGGGTSQPVDVLMSLTDNSTLNNQGTQYVALSGTETELTLPAPQFSVGSGTYSTVQSLTITDSSSAAAIYYTTDGTTPTAGSNPYNNTAIPISSSETIEAIAIASGYIGSPVTSATYTINLGSVAAPYVSVPAGTYTAVQSLYITDPTPGAVIYISINGQPQQLYTSPDTITISSTETIAIYVSAPGYTSVEADETYTIDIPSVSSGSFGLVPVGTQSSPLTITFTIPNAGTIGAPEVLTQGSPGLDFADAGTGTCTTNGTSHHYLAGATCTMIVTFKPLYAGSRNGAIVLVDGNGNPIAILYLLGVGSGPQVTYYPASAQNTLAIGAFTSAGGIAIDGAGDVFVAQQNNGDVEEILAGSGTVVDLTGVPNNASGVALDGAGNLFVTVPQSGSVYEVLAVGGYQTVNQLATSFGFDTPYGIAVDEYGNVFIADNSAGPASLGEIYEILQAGGYTTVNTLASSYASSFGFGSPNGVAVDANDDVFVAETGNNAVAEISAASGYVTVTPMSRTFGFNGPMGIAVDANSNVYVADTGNNAIKELLATDNYAAYKLYGGVSGPQAVAVDGKGNVYSDPAGSSVGVVMIDFADPPSLAFGATGVGSSSAPEQVAINNIGNATLNFSVPTSGDNPSISTNFTLNSSGADACPLVASGGSAKTLAAGGYCLLPVTFTPTATGSLTGSLVVTDNALNATNAKQTIKLSGTGLDGQTITFTDNLPATATYSSGLKYTLSATGGASGNPVTFSVTTGSSIANITGGSTLNITGVGTVTITANQAGNATYGAATPVTQTIVITAIPQTIAFTDSLPATATYSASLSYPLSATGGGSGNAVTFAITTGSGIANITGGNTLNITGVGTVTITANQAGSSNGDYAAATPVTQSIAITQIAQTIAFTDSLPATAQYGTGLHYTISATGGASGNAVTFSVTTGSSIASLNGATLSITGVGTVTITANQAGTSTYAAATAVTQSIVITAIPQTIAFTDSLPASAIYKPGLSYTLSATGGASGNPVTFSIAAGSSIANITGGNKLNITGVGTVTIAANQAGTANGGYAAGYASQSITINSLVVTTATDDATGNAANCPGSSCSLRDALAAAAAAGGGDITFSSTVFSASNTVAQNTITLGSGGTLNLPSNTTINGPTTGSGATLTNLVTVAGGGPSSNFSVFIANNQTTNAVTAAIANLTITNGNYGNGGYGSGIFGGGGILSIGTQLTLTHCTITGNTNTSTAGSSGGGGIYSDIYYGGGSLTLIDSTVSNNTAAAVSQVAGGIFNDTPLTIINSIISGNSAPNLNTSAGGIFNFEATLTMTGSTVSGNSASADGGILNDNGVVAITDSTIAGNSASTGAGGGIYNYGTLTVTGSTISGNSGGGGGGIENNTGTVALANTIVSGNTSISGSVDISGTYTDNHGNVVGASAIALAPLANYGGTTQTMIPLPGSPAICAGLVANIPEGATTDQRGQPNTNTSYTGYTSGTACVDSGSVQTDYSLSFSTEPPATVTAATNFTTAVTLDESGSAFSGGAVTIPLTLTGNGTLTGGSAATASGIAVYSTLQVSAAGTGDTLTANLALNSAATPAPAISATSTGFTVTAVPLTPQTIAFTDSLPASATYSAGLSYTISAAGGASGNPVTFTVSGPATLSGSTLNITGVGTVTVTANQAGNGAYAAATPATQSIVIGVASQTITFTDSLPASATYSAGLGYTISATGGGSGNPVTFTVSGPATLSGSTLNITGAGTVTVTANQAGNANYSAATPATQSILIGAASQTITFTDSLPASATYSAGLGYTISATGGASGNPVTFTVSGPGTLSGSALNITGAGTVTVTANQAGNANYSAATPATQSIQINGATAQTITFTDNLPASATYSAGLHYTISATGGGSGNPVTFTVSGPATLSGSTLNITGVGTVTVTANQAGNGTYAAATPATQSIVIGAASQIITFTDTLPGTATYSAGLSYTISATGGGSGNPVTFTVSGPATLSGSALNITGVGTVTVTANQAGNANYSAATAATQSILIGAASQTITFIDSLPASATYSSGLHYTISATGGGSGNPVTFTVSGPATLSGSTLNITGAGTVTVTANQAGNGTYAAATPATQSILIGAASQTITFTDSLPASATYSAGLSYTISATGGASGNPVTFTVSGPATLSGSALNITGVGTVTVTANQAGNANYSAATPATQSIVIGAASQTITFTDSLPASATYSAGLSYTISATGGGSGNPVTFTVSGPATLSGSALNITGAGTVTVTASQAAGGNYAAGTATQSILVNKATPVVTLTSSASTVFAQNAVTFTASVGSGPTGTVTFLDGATPLGTGTLNASGVATFTTSTLSAASHSITAAYGGDANFSSLTSSVFTITVVDFTISAQNSALTVIPGSAGQFALTVNPVGGTTFPAAIGFSASGLPSGATAVFSPSSIAAGAGATTVTLTIQTAQMASAAQPGEAQPGAGGSLGWRLAPFSLALLLLPFAGRMRKTGRRLSRFMAVVLLLSAGAAAMAGLSGCVSNTGFFAQSQQSYTVNVTGASGTLSHTSNVTLTVE